MYAVKAEINGKVRDFLRDKLAAGDEQVAGVFAYQGPLIYLRILLLTLMWTVVPALILPWWRFRGLAVTRDSVIVVAVSKITLAPRKIVSTTPTDRIRVDHLAGGRIWAHLRLTDTATGTAHRYSVSRPFFRDLDAVLAQLGAPARPHPARPVDAEHHHHAG